MEAGAAEEEGGAFGLSEARDGSPLSGATASDDGDTVIGVSYGVDAGDTGTPLSPIHCNLPCYCLPGYFLF